MPPLMNPDGAPRAVLFPACESPPKGGLFFWWASPCQPRGNRRALRLVIPGPPQAEPGVHLHDTRSDC